MRSKKSNNAIINVRQSFYLEGKDFTEEEVKTMNEILEKEQDWSSFHEREFDGI